jgi:hypothetical protein
MPRGREIREITEGHEIVWWPPGRKAKAHHRRGTGPRTKPQS